MFCKWCGMESETSDACSWCRHPFAAATPAREQAHAPAIGGAPASASPPAGQATAATDYDDLDDDLSLSPFGSSFRPERARPQPTVPQAPAPTVLDEFVPAVPEAVEQPAKTPRQVVPPFMPPQRTEAPAPAAPPPVPPPVPVQHRVPQFVPQPVVPDAPAAPPASQAAPPPVSPGRGGPGYTPVAQRPPADRPELQAIPIRRPAGPPGGPPGLIPIARKAQPPAPEPPTPPAAPEPEPPAQPGPRTPVPLAGVQPPAAPLPLEPRPLDVPAELERDEPRGNGAEPVEQLDLPPLEDFIPDEPQIGLGPGQVPPAPPRPNINLPHVGSSTRQTDRQVRPPARTWYCRWCGMESENADVCTWCRRDIRNLPAPGSQHHVTVTRAPGARRPAARPASPRPATPSPRPAVPQPQPAAPAPPAGAKAAPKLGMFQAQKSKYYTDKVIDPVSGAHYDADTGQAEAAPIPRQVQLAIDDNSEHVRQVTLYSGIVVGIVALVAVVLALTQGPQGNNALAIAIGAFLAGLAMPLVRLFPYGEDEAEDVIIAVVLALLLGPLAGAGAYAILWMFRQDGSPAIAAVFLVHLLIRITLDFVSGLSIGQMFAQLTPFSFSSAQGGFVVGIVKQCLPIVGIVGWFMASMARRFDD